MRKEMKNEKEELYELITGEIDNEQKQGLRKRIDDLFQVPSNILNLKIYSDNVLSKNIINVYEGLYRIRKLLSNPSDSLFSLIRDILGQPCLNKICQIALSSDINLLVYEALWIIANIGSGGYQQCKEIIKQKGIEIMMKSLESKFELIVDQAVWCIGNFSNETPFRNMLVQRNVISQLLSIAEKYKFRNQGIYQVVVWSLSNIVRTPPCLTDTKNNKLTEFFIKAVKVFDDGEYLIDALQALSAISTENYQFDSICERNIIPKLVKLQYQQNLLINCDSYNKNYFKFVKGRLQLDFDNLKIQYNKNIQYIIRKQRQKNNQRVAAGATSQVKEVLRNKKLMLKLLRLIDQQNLQFNKEINCIFSNALLNGTLEDIDYAINLGLLQGIKKLLSQTLIEEQLTISLQGIEGLLRKIQSDKKCLNKIINDHVLEEIVEQLQYHRDHQIYNSALKILVLYRDIRKQN